MEEFRVFPFDKFLHINISLVQRSYCVSSIEEEYHRKQNQYKNNSEDRECVYNYLVFVI